MNILEHLAAMRKRKVHIYCIGAAKTGTTSIAHMFNGPLRASHEPLVQETTQLVMDYLDGKVSSSECQNVLKKRDHRLNLELESSHPLGYVSPFLVRLFPEAKYIITVRNPYSWLKSRINFHLSRRPPEWDAYRHFIWSRHHTDYSPAEMALQQHGLYSLDAYLKQYSEQYKIIFDAIPESKRLVIKTNEISEKKDDITDFIGLQDIQVESVHTNKMSLKESLFDELPESLVNDKVATHCGWLIERFFD